MTSEYPSPLTSPAVATEALEVSTSIRAADSTYERMVAAFSACRADNHQITGYNLVRGVGDASALKVHVHTDEPDLAVASDDAASDTGEPPAATVRGAAADLDGDVGDRGRHQIGVRWKFWNDREGVGPRWPW